MKADQYIRMARRRFAESLADDYVTVWTDDSSGHEDFLDDDDLDDDGDYTDEAIEYALEQAQSSHCENMREEFIDEVAKNNRFDAIEDAYDTDGHGYDLGHRVCHDTLEEVLDSLCHEYNKVIRQILSDTNKKHVIV